MKKSFPIVGTFAILFLFFIQMSGTLVESIYILDLMNTSLDEKALGLLFFFTPAVLLFFRKRAPGRLVWVLFGLLFLVRGLNPYQDTLGRMLTSGIGTGTALMLFTFLLSAQPKGTDQRRSGLWASAGLALGVSLSVLLRTVYYSLDYSLTPAGGWAGWGLALVLGYQLTRLEWTDQVAKENKSSGLTSAVLGIFLVLTMMYFAFSAPAVIARWTEGSYVLIVITVSLLSAGWIWISLSRPQLLERVTSRGLALWNLLFTLSLLGVTLAHRVPFPQTPDSAPVVVDAPSWVHQLLLVLMLLLFPVVFLDLRVFVNRIQAVQPTPRALVPGMMLGSFVLVLLVFMNIFTNVWGYVEPVSPWFRNKFWLPHLLVAGGLFLLVGLRNRVESEPDQKTGDPSRWGWAILLGVIVLGTGAAATLSERVQPGDPNKASLVVMTYNIQQANDVSGEKSFDRQLELIRRVSPDIVALQESDSARISLNNNDYVRYFASRLGYYSYYGPTTITGTFGTAILSKYPLKDTASVFSFSDQDEIGTAEAVIEVGGRRFSIYNVHPDGSDRAMLAFAQTLLQRSKDKPNVIALGDYNLRDDEEAYGLIASVYTNAWESLYPSLVSPDGTDMSGRNRIDHIFISRNLTVRSAIYVLPPDSATDHPVHWAEISWDK